MKNFVLFISTLLLAGSVNAAPAKAAVCASCHGADGHAVIPMYPSLAGQNELYLVSSLKAYKTKQRNGGLSVVMQPQAAALTEAEINELAKYYSSMK